MIVRVWVSEGEGWWHECVGPRWTHKSYTTLSPRSLTLAGWKSPSLPSANMLCMHFWKGRAQRSSVNIHLQPAEPTTLKASTVQAQLNWRQCLIRWRHSKQVQYTEENPQSVCSADVFIHLCTTHVASEMREGRKFLTWGGMTAKVGRAENSGCIS